MSLRIINMHAKPLVKSRFFNVAILITIHQNCLWNILRNSDLPLKITVYGYGLLPSLPIGTNSNGDVLSYISQRQCKRFIHVLFKLHTLYNKSFIFSIGALY